MAIYLINWLTNQLTHPPTARLTTASLNKDLLQEPATGWYSKSDEFSPLSHTASLRFRYLCLCCTCSPLYRLSDWKCVSIFHHVPMHTACTTHPIILLFGQCKSCEAPHYGIFSSLLSLPLSYRAKYSPGYAGIQPLKQTGSCKMLHQSWHQLCCCSLRLWFI